MPGKENQAVIRHGYINDSGITVEQNNRVNIYAEAEAAVMGDQSGCISSRFRKR